MERRDVYKRQVIYRLASIYGGEASQILLGAALRVWNFAFVPLWGISQGLDVYKRQEQNNVKKHPAC